MGSANNKDEIMIKNKCRCRWGLKLTIALIFILTSGAYCQTTDSLKLVKAVDSINNIYSDEGMSLTEIKSAYANLRKDLSEQVTAYIDIEEKCLIAFYFSDHNLQEFAWQYAEYIEEKSVEMNYLAGKYGAFQIFSFLYHLDGQPQVANDYVDSILAFYAEKDSMALLITPLISKSIVAEDSVEIFEALHQALAIAIDINDLYAINNIYHNISYEYLYNGNLDSADRYIAKVKETSGKIGTDKSIAFAIWLEANLQLKRKQIELAASSFNKVLELNHDSTLNITLSALKALTNISEYQGNTEKALYFTKLLRKLENQNYVKAQSEVGLIFSEVSQLNEENYKKSSDLLVLTEQKKRLVLLIFFIAIGLISLTIFAFRQIKIKRLLKKKNDQISASELAVRKKNDEINESLEYAKLIQGSILPAHNLMQSCLTDYFVLHLPKDVVSGDFYWLVKIESKILFAVADCTGHGVPGALTSMICYSALEKAVKLKGLMQPSSILDCARAIIQDELSNASSNISDGMDISLCLLEGNELTYAGANNNMFILRQDELIELKADKMPIGDFPINDPFTQQRITLQNDDLLYLTSDGFSDQFGGEQGKKYKKSRFKSLLKQVSVNSMPQQKELLHKEFCNWKREYDQIDDVCVLGIRFHQ